MASKRKLSASAATGHESTSGPTSGNISAKRSRKPAGEPVPKLVVATKDSEVSSGHKKTAAKPGQTRTTESDKIASKSAAKARAPRAASVSDEEEETRAMSDDDEIEEYDALGKLKRKYTGAQAKKRAERRVHESTDEDDDAVEVVGSSEKKGATKGKAVEELKTKREKQQYADDELERLSKTWTSAAYTFFKWPPLADVRKDRPAHVFVCARPKCNHEVIRYLDSSDKGSISNMLKHIKAKCFGQDAWKAAEGLKAKEAWRDVVSPLITTGKITTTFLRKGNSKVTFSTIPHTRAEIKAETVRWCAESNRPFSIVEDERYRNLQKTGRPHYYVPSASTVSRDTKRIFARSRQRIAKMLQDYDGDLNFIVDCWTSPNHKPMFGICVTLHFNGEPLTLVLDVIEVAKSHMGLTLAVEFQAMLVEFGIEGKMCSVTADNASNNDAMVEELEDLIKGFSKTRQTRCFLHIINLIAKSFLRQFDPKTEINGAPATDAESQAYIDLMGEVAKELDRYEEQLGPDEDADDHDDGWVDELAEMGPNECVEINEKLKDARWALGKIRQLAFKIINSTTRLLPAWKAKLRELDLAIKLIPRDVRTRWNSTYDLLRFALKYRKAIEAFTGHRDNGVRALELTEPEWKILHQMCTRLKEATMFFSEDSPTLAAVIPVMDDIDEFFTEKERDIKLHRTIRASITVAKRTLNRYYSLTDGSEVYRIAMILHPRYRLSYFRDARWLEEWIVAATTLLRERFEERYNKPPAPASEPSTPVTSEQEQEFTSPVKVTLTPVLHIMTLIYFEAKNRYKDPSFKAPTAAALGDEIERYLASPVEDVQDPIQWWIERKAVYPRLSRMAIDYLLIPATSISVERLFSRGRLILNHTRSQLSSESIRALMCLGQWSKLDLVRTEDVLRVVEADDVPDDEDEPELEDGWDQIELELD
uniref:HAT C-terminal dimerisation domain-containing protein n=1 Tax=Mycena chlorophos TaxID=658473 RepID=A0ABQ0KX99_MYCCL|nr:predicted protein [Mycena chlorophos]